MDQQQQSRWPSTRRQLLWTGGIVAVLAVAILIGYRYSITLWDWIKLLVVPVVIAGGGIWFNRQQRERELEIAERRAQDQALQAYLDQMSAMLIPNTDQPSLYKARRGDSLSSVARARTLTVLPRLGGERKARVVQFLHESGLIAKSRPILALSDADLSGADLREANLRGADLREADLREAELSGADLRSGTNLSKVLLSGAVLRGAKMFGASLHKADLNGAELSGADLREVDLTRANLIDADLSGAELIGAVLVDANLSGVEGATNTQLEEQAWSLQSATMPNGQKYENWLKSKDREENGKNDGSP